MLNRNDPLVNVSNAVAAEIVVFGLRLFVLEILDRIKAMDN
ncbi:MAG: hypothetical protein OEU36_20305 [Gammaproteobacteria bacterium]|nr:hypothetical protein [Gammaproteobacteria bacterium]